MPDANQATLYKNFNSSYWLSKPEHVSRLLEWNTFFRRNLHLFATMYLGLSLHFYQIIILYFMGISDLFVMIAARGAAKSFIIAIYSCCRAILYPGSKIVIASATRGQAKLIISSKIKSELMSVSPTLCREIEVIRVSTFETEVVFKNGSSIIVVTALDNSRGHRANVLILEEYRQIKQQILNTVLAPFLCVRQPPYILKSDYNGLAELSEEPVEIYISSSWFKNHWMWTVFDMALGDMMNGGNSVVFAMDYSVTLRHNIRSRRQLLNERKKTDPITWSIEYLNLAPEEDASAFFTYKLLSDRQNLVRAFYPRSPGESAKSKLRCTMPRQDGEVRIVTADLAMMSSNVNDNSVFGLMRLMPETTYSEELRRNSFGYHVQIPYIETCHGRDTLWQTIRLKQLMHDFQADYLVMDARNFGISVYDTGCRVLFDSERQVEYKPWKCMNNEDIAKRINTNAEPNVYCITGSLSLNSMIANNMRQMFADGRVDILVDMNMAKEQLELYATDYLTADPEVQLTWEAPFMETMLLINECVELVYEKTDSGLTRIKERGMRRKDRYSSISYGLYFTSQLELDIQGEDGFDYNNIPFFVSSIDF